MEDRYSKKNKEARKNSKDTTFNGYNLYISRHYNDVKLAGEPTDVRYKILGPEWMNLSKRVKDNYKAQARDIQLQRSRNAKRSKIGVRTRASVLQEEKSKISEDKMLNDMLYGLDNYDGKINALIDKIQKGDFDRVAVNIKRSLIRQLKKIIKQSKMLTELTIECTQALSVI